MDPNNLALDNSEAFVPAAGSAVRVLVVASGKLVETAFVGLSGLQMTLAMMGGLTMFDDPVEVQVSIPTRRGAPVTATGVARKRGLREVWVVLHEPLKNPANRKAPRFEAEWLVTLLEGPRSVELRTTDVSASGFQAVPTQGPSAQMGDNWVAMRMGTPRGPIMAVGRIVAAGALWRVQIVAIPEAMGQRLNAALDSLKPTLSPSIHT